jgi:hypothetical protein
MAFPVEDRFPLLNLYDNEDDSSSGYDSPVFVLDSESGYTSPSGNHSNNTNDGSSSEEATSSEEEDGDDLDDLSDIDDNVHVSGTDTLVDNMRYILTMPALCDVTFHVGPQLLPVHGLKAVIGSRSQILQDKIVQQYNQQLLRRSKKRENCNREDVNIFINNYDFEVFKQFVDFLHTGSIVMDATSVVGLACAATEYSVPELESACIGFFKRCTNTTSNIQILQCEIDKYNSHSTTDTISALASELTQKTSTSPSRKETTV